MRSTNYKLNSFVTMSTYWVPNLLNVKVISGHLWLFIFIIICKWHLIYIIQQAYKYVSLSLWPHLTLFELKIPDILKSSGWGLEKSELPQEQKFLQLQVCFLQNYQPTKFRQSTLQIGQDTCSSIYCCGAHVASEQQHKQGV